MVECRAEFRCDELTDTLVAESLGAVDSSMRHEAKHLLRCDAKYHLGPWPGRVPRLQSAKLRKKASTPTPVAPQILPASRYYYTPRPYLFTHLIKFNYGYPSPYLKKYCDSARKFAESGARGGPNNRVRQLPELKIVPKPITLPYLSAPKTRSIPTLGSSNARTLYLQNGVQDYNSLKLPLVKLEPDRYSSKRNHKKQTSLSSKCSLVNIGVDAFHSPSMVIRSKEINLKAREHARSEENRDTNKKLGRF